MISLSQDDSPPRGPNLQLSRARSSSCVPTDAPSFHRQEESNLRSRPSDGSHTVGEIALQSRLRVYLLGTCSHLLYPFPVRINTVAHHASLRRRHLRTATKK